MEAKPSVWAITTDKDSNADFMSGIKFPCRICIAHGKPVGPIPESAVRVAGGAFDIAGKLCVLSAGAEHLEKFSDGYGKGTKTWDSSETGESTAKLNIKAFVKLGHLVEHPAARHFTIVQVDDKFRTCRNECYPECSTQISIGWLHTAPWQRGIPWLEVSETRGSGPVSAYDIELWSASIPGKDTKLSIYRKPGQDRKTITARTILRQASRVRQDLPPLSRYISGALVLSNAGYVGVATRLFPGLGNVEVLLLVEELWVYLADILPTSKGAGQSESDVPDACWKHLMLGRPRSRFD
ncbi:hypothetical protein F4808DRAFT_25428 [Astrocystis sublimbata]|nr:hypothetical protein F4808DRAFT_25428 [Astrocystis sublimbata]